MRRKVSMTSSSLGHRRESPVWSARKRSVVAPTSAGSTCARCRINSTTTLFVSESVTRHSIRRTSELSTAVSASSRACIGTPEPGRCNQSSSAYRVVEVMDIAATMPCAGHGVGWLLAELAVTEGEGGEHPFHGLGDRVVVEEVVSLEESVEDRAGNEVLGEHINGIGLGDAFVEIAAQAFEEVLELLV